MPTETRQTAPFIFSTRNLQNSEDLPKKVATKQANEQMENETNGTNIQKNR